MITTTPRHPMRTHTWLRTAVLFALTMTGAATLTTAQTATAQTATERTSTSTSTVFTIQPPDTIVLTGWDDARPADAPTSTPALASITVNDFLQGRNFRDRILLDHGPILSKPIAVPDHATTLTITGRSRAAGDIFPRVVVRLITPDNNRHRLFDGYWATLSLEPRHIPLTEFVKGKQVQLEMEILNIGVVEEERTFYFLRAEVR